MSKTLLDFEQMYLFFYSQVDYRILTLKYAFSINTFDIKNIDFTSGDEEQKKKTDNESLPEISNIPSEKKNQEC